MINNNKLLSVEAFSRVKGFEKGAGWSSGWASSPWQRELRGGRGFRAGVVRVQKGGVGSQTMENTCLK